MHQQLFKVSQCPSFNCRSSTERTSRAYRIPSIATIINIRTTCNVRDIESSHFLQCKAESALFGGQDRRESKGQSVCSGKEDRSYEYDY